MLSVKYIGMDVHKETVSIAVLNSSGKLVMEKSAGLRPLRGLPPLIFDGDIDDHELGSRTEFGDALGRRRGRRLRRLLGLRRLRDSISRPHAAMIARIRSILLSLRPPS